MSKVEVTAMVKVRTYHCTKYDLRSQDMVDRIYISNATNRSCMPHGLRE